MDGGGRGAWFRAAAALAAASVVLAALPAEARSRGRSRAAQQLRIAPPEDPDSPPTAWAAPTGTLDAAATWTRPGGTGSGLTRDNVGASSVLATRIAMPNGFSANLSLFYQPVPDAQGSSLFQPTSAWVETLNLRWTTESTIVFAGKFHPRFGEAWFRLPGLYAADFAGDYELREKIGAGAQADLSEILGLPEWLGDHDLRIEAFRADVTPLSGSAFFPRWSRPVRVTDDATGETATVNQRAWRNSLALGNPDNVPGVGGLVVSLAADGVDLPGDAALGWTVAASWRKPGEDAQASGRPATERGAVAALFADIGLPFGMRLLPLVEVAQRDNAGGYAGIRARWTTGAVTLTRGAVSLTGAAMWRSASEDGPGAPVQTRERAANLTVAIGQMLGVDALRPVSFSLDWRRVTQGGLAADDLAAGVLVSFSF
ncbi:hypothetical protein [Falsiroseomonas sp. HW251]|uniref:hypothetical protein n=1 Tax=Falsiroseomonas sp. HW251 TaxID=3390998 RepID=UPI003D321A1C